MSIACRRASVRSGPAALILATGRLPQNQLSPDGDRRGSGQKICTRCGATVVRVEPPRAFRGRTDWTDPIARIESTVAGTSELHKTGPAAIGRRRKRRRYDPAQPLPNRLADLLRKVQEATSNRAPSERGFFLLQAALLAGDRPSGFPNDARRNACEGARMRTEGLRRSKCRCGAYVHGACCSVAGAGGSDSIAEQSVGVGPGACYHLKPRRFLVFFRFYPLTARAGSFTRRG